MVIATNNKYPCDGIRLDWDSIIKKIENVLDIYPDSLRILQIFLEVKKLYRIDDIEGYFKYRESNIEEFKKIESYT